MSDAPALDVADFGPYFRAVHGQEPFPWQERLVHRVATDGWPGLLDLPTGTGKTAALDIAVFALALAAGRSQHNAPRRIVYVVDRRTIVSQAHDRAVRIREAITTGTHEVLRRVRQRLETLSGGGIPLRTAELRGGLARDDMWSRTPDQPLIAVSTVDQVGSRLLFRGYGVSDLMKPVHAGLLGNDVLYLLDEVHLSQPFLETLSAVGSRYRSWAEAPIRSPFVVVEMSATPGRVATEPFTLGEDDRRHPILSQRLRSSKPVSLLEARASRFVEECVKQVGLLLDRPGATIGVVVNRVKTARELHRRISQSDMARAHLLTGRMRPLDRDRLDRELLHRIRAGRVRRDDDPPVVVIATQTIEAGADFDFDGLVAECASLDALRQRFGRLDRLGALSGASRGVIVAKSDTLKDDPVYGEAIGKAWEWLNAEATDGIVDFGLESFAAPSDAEQLGLLAPRAHAPVLLPAHLDAWVQTAPVPMPDPDVSLWLHGPDRGVADVQVVWRADLTAELLTAALESADALEVVVGMVEALPPVSAEAMTVPFLAVKRWLDGRAEPDFSDVEGARDDRSEAPPQSEETARPVLVWRGDNSQVVGAERLRPGQTIVVPADYGGIAAHNWDPASRDAVADLAELAGIRNGRRPVLRLHERVAAPLLGVTSVPEPGDAESEGASDREVVREWLAHLNRSSLSDGSQEVVDALLANLKALRVSRLPMRTGEGAREYLVVVGRRPLANVDFDNDDRVFADGSQSSFIGVDVTLAKHQRAVAALAAAYATRSGFDDAGLTADLRLCGEWHDSGKCDFRFQRWLHGGSEFKALVQGEPLAKGVVPLIGPRAMRAARERAGYPARGRHELTSLALLEAAGPTLAASASDWSLVRHLVASHHGHCRPFAPWVPDDHPVDVAFSRADGLVSVSSAHSLERVDSGVAERFWLMVRKYGWWGLAYLEAILRLADQRQSAREQAGDRRDG